MTVEFFSLVFFWFRRIIFWVALVDSSRLCDRCIMCVSRDNAAARLHALPVPLIISQSGPTCLEIAKDLDMSAAITSVLEGAIRRFVIIVSLGGRFDDSGLSKLKLFWFLKVVEDAVVRSSNSAYHFWGVNLVFWTPLEFDPFLY